MFGIKEEVVALLQTEPTIFLSTFKNLAQFSTKVDENLYIDIITGEPINHIGKVYEHIFESYEDLVSCFNIPDYILLFYNTAVKVFGEDKVDILYTLKNASSDSSGIDIDKNILIKFDDYNITNSNNMSVHIDNTFVKIMFNAAGSLTLTGTSTFTTADKYISSYRHSHLSSIANYDFTSFCLGTGPLSTMVIEYKLNKNSIEYIEFLLYNLEQYLLWESIEGRPYKFLNDISGVKKVLNYLTLQNIFDSNGAFLIVTDYLTDIPAHCFKYDALGNPYIEFNSPTFHNFLNTNNNIRRYIGTENRYCFKNNEGEYYSIKRNSSVDTYSKENIVNITDDYITYIQNDKPITYFKNKLLYLTIKEELNLEENERKTYFRPGFVSELAYQINKSIFKYANTISNESNK
jgi:hypothetical protein